VTVAVVSAGYGDPWREDHLLVRRLAGALACATEVDVLHPNQLGDVTRYDGAVRVLGFRTAPPDPVRRQAWRKAILGEDAVETFAPPIQRPRLWHDFAPGVEEQLLSAEGGDSPALCKHLRSEPYDLVVVVGHHTPLARSAVRALPRQRKLVVVPANRYEPTLGLKLHDEIFERAERIIVSTEGEKELLLKRLDGSRPERVENLRFAVGVNWLACKTEPLEFDHKRYVVIARDWNKPVDTERLLRWAKVFEHAVDKDLRLRLVGPGAWRIEGLGLVRTGSRLDVCRWISRAFAVLDPTPDRLIGREVLDAYLFGTPVLTREDGGASRDHAERGNGGLWYRTEEQLFGAVEALLNDNLRIILGRQGQAYAQAEYADSDLYVKQVLATLLD
jgi:glycosyltransferase involved in cell wall biosynthesis